MDLGIKCIIAPSFADIFYNNSFKNGILPIAITNQPDLDAVAAEARAGREIEVDLPSQVINDAGGRKICGFEIEEFRKYCLVNGLDDIGLTMQMEEKISDFESRRYYGMPWLERSGFSRRKNGAIDAKPLSIPTRIGEGERRKFSSGRLFSYDFTVLLYALVIIN